nr:GNAT family N-acetyltransferase [Prolixibacteraceae bacterium]
MDISTIELSRLSMDDYQELKKSMIEAYSNWQGAFWKEEHIRKLISIFPEGQIAVLADGNLVGCALSVIVNYSHFGDSHNYAQITGNYTFNTHNPKGDVLYGIEIFIKPGYRGLRLGRRLYDARKELCESLNLKAIVFGGRIPNYHKYAEHLSPKEYLQKVKYREIHDPTLSFQLSNDFHVKKILKNYLPGDSESKDYAVLLQWDNIYYEKSSEKISSYKSVVRLGLIQWQMRPYKTVDEMFEQIEFFVDAVSGYKSDFALFPEFFNAPLMAAYNHLSESMAIRELAQFTENIRDRFLSLAISYNVNIITGSMPVVREGKLYNIGYLCRRNGTFETYEKLHVTPDEEKVWGLMGGS